MTEFSKHGAFSLSVDGRLLVVEVEGPWNLELIHSYGEETRPIAEEMARTGPWVLISIAKRSALFTPEAIDLLRQTAITHVRRMGRIATAYVVDPTVEGYRLVDAIYETVYRGVCEVAVFETRAEAEGWAQEQLRQHPHP